MNETPMATNMRSQEERQLNTSESGPPWNLKI